MSKETQNTGKTENGNYFIADVGCSAIVENEQVELFFQFDDDEPISAMRCNGKKFTIEMMPIKNSFVTFTDGKKTMKLFVKHCN